MTHGTPLRGYESNAAAATTALQQVTTTVVGNKTLLDCSATVGTLTVNFPGLIDFDYDYVLLGYTGMNMTTATFKTGGSGGTTVATLTMTYDGNNNMTSVTKT